MRLSRIKVTVYITTVIVIYVTFVYVMLNFPLFSKMTSLLRHILSMRSSQHVYGFGTVMVDVRSLGKRLADDKTFETMYSSRKNMHGVRNKNKSRNFCFDLSFGRNRDFDIDEENELFTSERNVRSSERHSQSTIDRYNNLEDKEKKGHCKGYITVDSPPGRSGNQMFQIAALLGTAYNLDLIPVIPTDFPLSEWVDLPNVINLNLTNAHLFVLKSSGRYSDGINYLNKNKNWTLRGYFQSWKFFLNAENVIKKAFRIKESYIDVTKSFIKNMSRPRQVNVCVHVRRGDLSDKVAVRKGYAIAGLDFIEKAMNFYREKYKHVQFIVLSDGIHWCMENIRGTDVKFSPFFRYAEDMALMTMCDHVIVTSGTFGWWGAWLSGGLTVYFNGYPKPGSWLASQINKKDYYPEHWIAM